MGDTNKTVTFDVGGTIYRVSRSLLEQHPDTMLARLASETWSPACNKEAGASDGDKTSDEAGASDRDETTNRKKRKRDRNCDTSLFIERNGERFQYVTDYMRDGGTVVLPPTIPKDALLQDLIYYGFQDIDPSMISVTGSVHLYASYTNQIDSDLKGLGSEIKGLEGNMEGLRANIRCLKLAEHCLACYRNAPSLRIQVNTIHTFDEGGNLDYAEMNELNATAELVMPDEKHGKTFGEIMERYGLLLKNREDQAPVRGIEVSGAGIPGVNGLYEYQEANTYDRLGEYDGENCKFSLVKNPDNDFWCIGILDYNRVFYFAREGGGAENLPPLSGWKIKYVAGTLSCPTLTLERKEKYEIRHTLTFSRIL